jgi:hypothetical protein
MPKRLRTSGRLSRLLKKRPDKPLVFVVLA